MHRNFLALCIAFLAQVSGEFEAKAADDYSGIIRGDTPVAWWRMEGLRDGVLVNDVGDTLHATPVGKLVWNRQGPSGSEYPDFASDNRAVRIGKGTNHLVVTDPGDDSPLDFKAGESLTIEAWVQIDEPLSGSYPCILGKGRTFNPETSPHNQNYSLRLAPNENGACISFYFVDGETQTKGDDAADAGHRWTSNVGVPEDGAWHHVAVTYTFGDEESLKGYIDGTAVPGKWDMGGATDKPPVVDNDELWIGSAMRGKSTLGANLDEVALYRTALSTEQIQRHARINLAESALALGKLDPATIPADRVRVEVMESVPVARSWRFRLKPMELLYETDLFALKELPNKYDAKGLIAARPVGSLIHLASKVQFGGGEYEFCLRSLDAARLYIDGELIAETEFMSLRSDAHQAYYDLPHPGPDMLSIAGGHQERCIKVAVAEGEHIVSLYRLVGNRGHGSYLGEMSVGIAAVGEKFAFLSPTRSLPFTDAAWLQFLDEDRARLQAWNQQVRLAAGKGEEDYWQLRHVWAQANAGPRVDGLGRKGVIDSYINANLSTLDKLPMRKLDDWSFLRRVCLDTIGTIPSQELLDRYYAYPSSERRERIVDDLLTSDGWAHHWVGYWQDVLAENPGLTKPELNNTGPFRWYLFESFLDNKSLDRFVTELVLMDGNPHFGGPAGFGIASQNDVPMAAKAHVLGTAFLGVEMKCARCHDAPYHDVQQRDLFSIAAMLKRGEEQVPGTSTVPATPEQLERMAVKVTLPPGSSVKPDWPFVEFVSFEGEDSLSAEALPKDLLRNPDDPRQQLATMLTSPRNERFARVFVNRLWKRYLGRGFIEPIDDWEGAEAAYPELMDYLARELVTSGYDVKHVARLILTSDVYQRECIAGLTADSKEATLFCGPIRRKLTGEQVADSLYLATGKPYRSEELTMDGDGKQDEGRFGHLGIPARGWQFAAVSNERDRPSMTLPVAQGIVDLMSAFGWRQQRQDPLTVREDPLTALQPMALANGSAAARAMDFTEDSALTTLAIDSPTVESFVDGLFERLLTRPAMSDERELFVGVLREGFEGRIIAGPEAVPPRLMFRTGITWSNHFAPQADVEAMNRQREVIAGESPTVRLDADWRQRAEDVVWTLVNSPEFVFVP